MLTKPVIRASLAARPHVGARCCRAAGARPTAARRPDVRHACPPRERLWKRGNSVAAARESGQSSRAASAPLLARGKPRRQSALLPSTAHRRPPSRPWPPWLPWLPWLLVATGPAPAQRINSSPRRRHRRRPRSESGDGRGRLPAGRCAQECDKEAWPANPPLAPAALTCLTELFITGGEI